MKELYIWLITMFQKLFKGGLPVETEEKEFLKLDLQFFADGDGDDDGDEDNDDDDGDDSGDDDDHDDAPDLEELLKDPAFKKQYNAKFKEQLSKRMKRHNKELERLKGDKQKDNDDGGSDDDAGSQEKEKRLLRAERREKRAVVKEFAVDNGHNPRLLARLIDLDEIELDDNGEPENLDDLFEELEEEFPEYFGASDDDDEEDEKPSKKRFVPGSKQKLNKKKKVDPKEAGRQKALARHKKEEKQ